MDFHNKLCSTDTDLASPIANLETFGGGWWPLFELLEIRAISRAAICSVIDLAVAPDFLLILEARDMLFSHLIPSSLLPPSLPLPSPLLPSSQYYLSFSSLNPSSILHPSMKATIMAFFCALDQIHSKLWTNNFSVLKAFIKEGEVNQLHLVMVGDSLG